MASGPQLEVDSWEAALGLLRFVRPDATVTVPKRAEPRLPPELPLRPSNAPWSVHQGARRVYREDRRGAHIQIREYPDRWTLQLDASNPHYRPIRHVAYDTGPYTVTALAHPLRTATAMALYAPARTVRLGTGLLDVGFATVERLLPPLAPSADADADE